MPPFADLPPLSVNCATIIYVEDSLAMGPESPSNFVHRYMRGDLSNVLGLRHEMD